MLTKIRLYSSERYVSMWGLNLAGLSSRWQCKRDNKGGERKGINKQGRISPAVWVSMELQHLGAGPGLQLEMKVQHLCPKWPSPCSSGHQMLTFHSISVHYFLITLMLSGFRVRECVCVHAHKKAKRQHVVLTSRAVRPLPWRQSFV